MGSLDRAGLSATWLCLQAQNELIWSIKDELKKVCSTNDLKELLIFNKQQVPSGESAVSCLRIMGHVGDAGGAWVPECWCCASGPWEALQWDAH